MTNLPITLETIFSLPALPLEYRELLPEIPGLYFAYSLSEENQLLYIGKAQNIREQWLKHHRLRDLQIVACVVSQVNLAWLEFYASDEILTQQEQVLIKQFKPPINELNPPDNYRMPTEQKLIGASQAANANINIDDEVVVDVFPQPINQPQKKLSFWTWLVIVVLVLVFCWGSFS
ncbi:MAG: GIY-YIG nuclease family protein [Symploca sp. SIO3C6]|uniref:GIY-YIG nuclease family protein n=1 Tax=Symploca sp. SIO1C4 TaxID=2607765 RepID=A0A6B3NLH1_9CYAN|nr:GIY-YIG nuclease family protein [Symploca sp. SIO3C6]NER30048.1 GIY-YIG nuclease family protein [Symploca sp. SIO1C4]NET04068.1 GIY-YIG nuclease family protein [Symploca sp. SIO2B6]NET52863.1 GIY-YIG nuclease family protein [Merismopedia sp. SIO2A8]